MGQFFHGNCGARLSDLLHEFTAGDFQSLRDGGVHEMGEGRGAFDDVKHVFVPPVPFHMTVETKKREKVRCAAVWPPNGLTIHQKKRGTHSWIRQVTMEIDSWKCSLLL